METLWTIYSVNPLGWGIALGATFTLVGLHYYPVPWFRTTTEKKEDWLFFPRRGRGRMLRKARRNFVIRQAIDDFVHCVEERVYNGIYSRDEGNELYRQAKKAWPVTDLFPSPELLKENIRTRLAATSKNLPVPLPDATPQWKPKHMFDKQKA